MLVLVHNVRTINTWLVQGFLKNLSLSEQCVLIEYLVMHTLHSTDQHSVTWLLQSLMQLMFCFPSVLPLSLR